MQRYTNSPLASIFLRINYARNLSKREAEARFKKKRILLIEIDKFDQLFKRSRNDPRQHLLPGLDASCMCLSAHAFR